MRKDLLIVALLMAGCVADVQKRGFEGIRQAAASITVCKDTQCSVRDKLGAPNTTSCDGNKIWYYVSQTQETKAFLAPEIKEKLMLKVAFDDKGRVCNKTILENYGKKIKHVDDTTPTHGANESYIQDIVGNIKKFSALSDKSKR